MSANHPRLVIDASAIIAVAAEEPHGAWVLQQTQNAQLVAPLSVHFEIGNASIAMLKKGRLDLVAIQKVLGAYSQMQIEFVDVDIAAAVRIAATLGLYAYDAYLVWCAAEYGLPLLALDRKLKVSAERYGVQVMEMLA